MRIWAFLDVYIIACFLRKGFNYTVICKAHNMLVYGNREIPCSIRRMQLKNNLGDTQNLFYSKQFKVIEENMSLKTKSIKRDR